MTEEKKGVSAWLRGIIDECGVSGTQSCAAIAKAFDINCKHERTCRDCISKMMTTIADRIDAERALPEGVEWPRFEDGEMVKFGDEVEFEGEAAKVLDVAFSVVRFSLGVGTATTSGRVYGFLGEPAKRPAPEVLDADGVPIRIGDVVYGNPGIAWTVVGLRTSKLGWKVEMGNMPFLCEPDDLTHKKPDSWEKLEEDARKQLCSYFGLDLPPALCDDCPHGSRQTGRACWQNVRLDMIARAKKLAGIEEEARND